MTQRLAWFARYWRALAGAALGGALFAVLGLSLFSSASKSPREFPEELRGEPDLYMRDALITEFDADGSMKYQLASQQIRHFEIDQLTRLTNPKLSLYNPTQPPWQISSEHGYIRETQSFQAREEVVFLRENVELKQVYADGRHLRLRSPALYLYPEREFAETDQDVMIDTDVGRTKAVGLKGDLQRGSLNLFSSAAQRVHTIVLPNQFK